MLEETEPDQGTPSLSVAACYPELAAWIPERLRRETVEVARASAEWREIVGKLTDVAIKRIGQSLGALVPTLETWAALDVVDVDTLEKLAIRPLSARSRNVLLRNHLETWGKVGTVSPEFIGGFTNAVINVVRDTTRLAIELGAAVVVDLVGQHSSSFGTSGEPVLESLTTPIGRWVVDGPMQKLTAWGLTQSEAMTLGQALDRATSGERVPADVADAAAVIWALPLRELASARPPSYAELVVELLGELSEVEQEVLRRRVYTTSPVTLEAVGTDLAVTRERVRQIQVRAEERIETQLASSRFAPVHWAAFTLHSALGSLAPAEAVARELSRLVGGIVADNVIVATTILLRLAGPYRIERTAYVTEGVRDLPTRLRGVADPHGVIAVEDVHNVLATCGVLPEFFDSALAWLDQFRRFGDALVAWPNNGVDKLVAMLALRGQPADTETLVRECGEDYSTRALHNRLGEEPRVVRVSRREWGLVEWGLEEYSGIAEEIAQRIGREGGRALLTDVVAEVARFGVRESSVRMYAEAPMFVIEGDWIRMRGDDERAHADDGVDEARRTYRLAPTTIAYLIEVDYDTLRGSGKAIPRGTSVALGVQPGAKVRFASDDGDIVVSWPLTAIAGPSIGSVRSHALAHGLCEGDHLRIVFDTYTTTASSFGITQRELSTLDATRRAVALTGIEGLTGSNVANDLARAIEAPMGSLRRALIGRGDEALLQLLPTDSGSPELDEALARLARALTESH